MTGRTTILMEDLPPARANRDLLARGGLLVSDVAAIFTDAKQEEENAKARAERRDPAQVEPVSERTVLSFVDFSQPLGRSLVGTDRRIADPTQRNRYEDNPMPLPVRVRNQLPVWVPDPDNPAETLDDVREALRRWWHERRKREV